METFEKTTLIDCSAKELFDFHLDTNNIKGTSNNQLSRTLF